MPLITTATKEYQKKAGYSEVSATVLSNTHNLNKVFYKTTNGKLDPEMLFKNPYKDESLKTYESEYLKFMLWQINKWKIKGLTEADKKLSYKEAEKLEAVKEEISKGYGGVYFEVPLRKGMDYTRMKQLTRENIVDAAKEKIGDLKDLFDQRDVVEEQRLELSNQTKNYNYMYNQFRTSRQTRQNMLKNHNPEYWEINLDKIVLDHEMAYIREITMNKALPTVNSALVVLKYYANQTGTDISETLDYFLKQIKVSIFNESIIDEEIQDPLKVVNIAKRALSISSLALRPTIFIKEMTVGSITNVIRAFTQVYGENSFNISHLTQAYTIMMGAKKQFSRDFNVINGLDYTYGIANMDINSVVERTRADRSGLMSGLSKHLFKTSTAADYVNRMTLFIAQMIHDGCWEAHSVTDNGELIYDFKKDKRFDEYIKHRENPNYKSETFLNQKAEYLYKLKQLNSEGYNLKVGDDLPKAYTAQDRESLKSFADMAYGYYDHEKKSMLNNMAFGTIFMQFMTYWTAKVKTWMIKPGSVTAQGRMVDKVEFRDGVEIPVYIKEIFDEDGNIIDIIETTETDGTLARAKVWEGTKMEGLLYSLLYTLRDIFHFKFSDVMNNKQRLARVTLAMHDILWATLGLYLARLMWMWIKDAMGIDDKDEEYSMMESAITSLEKTNYRALSEFNPYANIFGNLTFEPRFASFAKKLGNDFVNTLSDDDKSVADFTKKYIKAMEIVPM